jgi:hypothetical protein
VVVPALLTVWTAAPPDVSIALQLHCRAAPSVRSARHTAARWLSSRWIRAWLSKKGRWCSLLLSASLGCCARCCGPPADAVPCGSNAASSYSLCAHEASHWVSDSQPCTTLLVIERWCDMVQRQQSGSASNASAARSVRLCTQLPTAHGSSRGSRRHLASVSAFRSSAAASEALSRVFGATACAPLRPPPFPCAA